MVSIIVPVYNAEVYIEDAIKSVLNQTYKNIELLLINDGSKDNSASICKRYAMNNPIIKFYDKSNEGVSKTRNFGIDHASGDYICFL